MKIKKIIFDAYKIVAIHIKWFCFRLFSFKPRVLSKNETIQLIIDKKLSISRFGDGEFRLMTQKGKIGFQDSDPHLSKALVDAFNTRNNNMLICSFDFREKRPMNNYAGKWLKSFIYYRYNDIKSLFDKKYIYGNAEITRFYNPAFYKTTDFDYLANTYIPLLKKIWEQRNVIIVEGEETKLGVGNDLFDSCLTVRRIICPSKNAYDKYDDILNSILHHYKQDDMILLALGPTASVLSVQLCVEHAMQSIDIGHIDVVYYWFLNRCKEPCNIEGKYVNEATPNSAVISFDYDKSKYEKEIVDKIL